MNPPPLIKIHERVAVGFRVLREDDGINVKQNTKGQCPLKTFDFSACQGSEDAHTQECGVCSVTVGRQVLSPPVHYQRVQTLCCFLSRVEDYCRLPPPLTHSLLALASPLCAPRTPAGPQARQHEPHLQDTVTRTCYSGGKHLERN